MACGSYVNDSTKTLPKETKRGRVGVCARVCMCILTALHPVPGTAIGSHSHSLHSARVPVHALAQGEYTHWLLSLQVTCVRAKHACVVCESVSRGHDAQCIHPNEYGFEQSRIQIQ